MDRRIIIGLVVAGVILLLLVLPSVLRAAAKGNAKSRCEALRVEFDIATLAQDAVKIRTLESQMAECNRDLEALGVSIDPGEEQLKLCEFQYDRVEDWWRIYINTDWADGNKRNANYAAITQSTRELGPCIESALPLCRTEASLSFASSLLDRAIKDCNARKRCNLEGGYGCGRLFGVYIEAHPNDRATQEDVLIGMLAQVYPAIQRRREAIAGSK